jgi:hypothetical protein
MEKNFVNKKHYEIFLYAVELAKKINNYLKEDCVVYNEDYSNGKFKFTKKTLTWKSGDCSFMIIGFEWNEKGKIYVQSKKEIDKFFRTFKIIRPENIEYVC